MPVAFIIVVIVVVVLIISGGEPEPPVCAKGIISLSDGNAGPYKADFKQTRIPSRKVCASQKKSIKFTAEPLLQDLNESVCNPSTNSITYFARKSRATCPGNSKTKFHRTGPNHTAHTLVCGKVHSKEGY